MRINTVEGAYTFDMSREEVLVTNAVYQALDYVRRRGSSHRRGGVPDWLATDFRVGFSDWLPVAKDKRVYPTSWYILTPESEPTYVPTAAPRREELRTVYSVGRWTVDAVSEEVFGPIPMPSSQLLQVEGDAATMGSLASNTWGSIIPRMTRLYHQLGWHIEGPSYRYDMD